MIKTGILYQQAENVPSISHRKAIGRPAYATTYIRCTIKTRTVVIKHFSKKFKNKQKWSLQYSFKDTNEQLSPLVALHWKIRFVESPKQIRGSEWGYLDNTKNIIFWLCSMKQLNSRYFNTTSIDWISCRFSEIADIVFGLQFLLNNFLRRVEILNTLLIKATKELSCGVVFCGKHEEI